MEKQIRSGNQYKPKPNAPSRNKSFGIWRMMHDRCYKSKYSNYKYYGAKGIFVEDSWHIYANFVKDMGEPPEGLWLDRINNKGNYSKENCRWATPAVQLRNRSNSRYFTFKGKTQNVKDWATELRVNYNTVYSRLRLGFSMEQALGIVGLK